MKFPMTAAQIDEIEGKLPEGQFIDDCACVVDVLAEWSELTEDWI